MQNVERSFKKINRAKKELKIFIQSLLNSSDKEVRWIYGKLHVLIQEQNKNKNK